MIKINKKIRRTTSLTSVLFGVFIVNFEVNVSWEGIVTRNRQNKRFNKCDALRDWLPFVQFKKIKNIHGGVSLVQGCYSRFLNVHVKSLVQF